MILIVVHRHYTSKVMSNLHSKIFNYKVDLRAIKPRQIMVTKDPLLWRKKRRVLNKHFVQKMQFHVLKDEKTGRPKITSNLLFER